MFNIHDYNLNLKFKLYNPSFVINQVFKETDFTNNIQTPANLIDALKQNEADLRSYYGNDKEFETAQNHMVSTFSL